MVDLEHEMWLANRLRLHGEIFAGVTTSEIRKQRVREAIERLGTEVVVGRGKDRQPVTYRQAFETLYGEPLRPTPKHPATRTEDPRAESTPGSTE